MKDLAAELDPVATHLGGDRCQTCDTRLARIFRRCAHQATRPPAWREGPVCNVLCLCPNCHVMFDNGALIIDDELKVWINGDPAGTLRVHKDHKIDRNQLAYHRQRYG